MTGGSTSNKQRPLALITGASRGIGRALVEAFAAAGFDIFAIARRKEGLEALQQFLASNHPNQSLYTHAGDLSKQVVAQKVADIAHDLQRPLDVLINNAGAFVSDRIQSKENKLPEQLSDNLFSAYYLTRSLIRGFITQKKGYIFNICSVASLNAYPGGASYSISKHALYGFSKVLREELRPHGVRVSTVLPGAVLTDSWKGTELPNERFIQPKDIAESVLSAYRLSSGAVVEDLLIRPQLGDI